jgi:hypothetical protein
VNDERRPYWFVLTGVVIGIVLGLLYAWVWVPVEHIDTHPVTLRDDFKDTYRALIALGYTANGDEGRARARLALLGDPDPARTLAIQAQQTLADGGSADAARALGILAAALEGQLASSEAVEVVVVSATHELDATLNASPTAEDGTPQSEATDTPQATASATPPPTPRPSQTATPTQGAPFTLRDFTLICNPNLSAPLIQVYVYGSGNVPAAGVKAIVSWDGGQDSFFTGLKPEIGFEYGDFEMTPGVSYSVRLVTGGEPITGLTPTECTDGSPPYWGSWRLNFTQP